MALSNKARHKANLMRGLGFRSVFEETVNNNFKKNKLTDIKYEPFSIPYVIESKYTPDWVLPNGIIIEAKGKLDPDTRKKMVAVKDQNPHLDIRFIFMRSYNRISKNSWTTYGEWCDKNGFKWMDVEDMDKKMVKWYNEPKKEIVLGQGS